MIDTSGDILNIVKAFSISLITVFLCWAIFYLGRGLKQMFRIIKEVGDLVAGLDSLVKKIHEKVEHSASYLFLIGEGIKTVIGLMKEYGPLKSEDDKKKKKKSAKK